MILGVHSLNVGDEGHSNVGQGGIGLAETWVWPICGAAIAERTFCSEKGGVAHQQRRGHRDNRQAAADSPPGFRRSDLAGFGQTSRFITLLADIVPD